MPKIPADLLHDEPSPKPSTTPLLLPPAILHERSLNKTVDSDATPTQETAPKLAVSPPPPTQRPQQQYILTTDAPAPRASICLSQDDAVQQLIRSASISPPAAQRTRKAALRFKQQDKEEHAAAASTSAAPAARQPTLARKTSISAHLKLGLRRRKSEEENVQMVISGPTDFVHISTGSEGAHSSAATTSLRRASTVSTSSSNRTSLRSSVFSASSGSSNSLKEEVEAEDAASEDRPLYTKHPLRPLKSIRRPSMIKVQSHLTDLPAPTCPTSPRDKRKAIYALPGSVPALLEPTFKLNPPTTPSAGDFAATLDRTLSRTHRLGSDASEQIPEPGLSRSPSSGYASSNRSSLGSLSEFRSYLDFPEIHKGKKEEQDIWEALDRGVKTANASMPATPIVLAKF